MILMVCGGRDFGMMRRGKPPLLTWGERNRAIDALNDLDEECAIACIIHGECPDGGADLIADLWARSRRIKVDPTPVDFKLDGSWPEAGPYRNARMIAKRPDMVLALPGGAGTANAVRQARAAGIEVRVIGPDGAVVRVP